MQIFNRQTALHNSGDDADFLRELAGMFLEDAPVELAGIEEAFAGNDTDKARFHAHALKGMSGNLGLENLYELCLAMETSARNCDLAAAAGNLPLLRETYARTREELEKFCAGGG